MQGHVVAQGTGGETLTYTWSSPQKGTFGTTPDVSFTCAGPDYQQSPFTPVTVAVIDSKGNSVKQSIAFTVADLRGSYSLVVGPLGTQRLRGITFFLSLKRKGNALTGTINDGNHYGTVDPAEAGTLDADGLFHIRFKEEYDFSISGQLVIDTNPQYGYSPGYYGIGYIQGGPNDGKQFVLRLEDPY